MLPFRLFLREMKRRHFNPANAAGMYSYMEGVAALRMIFLSKEGWKIVRPKGVEAVANTELGIMVLFQNVDHACAEHDPSPISAKGEGVIELVDNPSGYLWDYMAEEDQNNENRHVWFFCVSSSVDEIRAELSRPRAIKNGNFGTFAERIFIVQDNDWNPTDDDTGDNPNDGQDFDVPVSKKR